MNSEYDEQALVVDFDELQGKLAEGSIEILMGFTKAGDVLIASRSVDAIRAVPKKCEDPVARQLNMAGFPSRDYCCSQQKRYRVFRLGTKDYCFDTGTACVAGDFSCDGCTFA